MDPLTSWALLIVVGGPWVVGVVALVKRLVRYLDRLDATEPLYVEPRTIERLERQ